MTSKEIRQQFIKFFEEKGHKFVPSAPVVPYDDPTLLFTNAGMNQFKDIFLATGKRDYTRAVNTQKCIRVSGKHNDLEEVGYDTYHHTFFEMLGNWSFGDYYKLEAITWAWELLTEVWKLPKERLWATVYRTDDEAYDIWKNKTDINPNHILRFDEKDNFWEMGETGPCGPCSEIHINLSDDYDNPDFVNAGKEECKEIWNLVFIQYNRNNDGSLTELPAKHVDTGMGFERICAVLQKVNSNYDTDIFTPIINAVVKLSGIPYEKEEDKISIRVISDHIRTLTFAIADGAMPSNEGRGYVLRRILRRASRYGRKLHLKKPFLYELVDVLVDKMGEVFPEIIEKKEFVKKIIHAEEESFNRTLDRGIELFDDIVKKLNQSNVKVISGDDAFKLYDTYGFPVDLTNVMARELGFSIDEKRFNELMNEQKERARQATKEKLSSINIALNDLNGFEISNVQSSFVGYDELKSNSKIVGLKKQSDSDFIILDKTPFYVEAGGQIDDNGKIIFNDNELNVVDVTKIEGNTIHVLEGDHPLFVGGEVIAQVDEKRRWDIMRNHTATHFLHSALREILGTHVHQAGSYVGPDRLRFDFAHYSKVSESELTDIETLINEKLRENIPLVHHRGIPFEEAKKMGALMFFGDKYGDYVNVVQFGEFSKEFCGGTHVKNSSEIGLVKIVSEGSIASGIRRIEAVSGLGIQHYINSLFEKIKHHEEKADLLLEQKKKLEKELSELKLKTKLAIVPEILSAGKSINGLNVYIKKLDADSADEVKAIGDELRNKINMGIVLLLSIIDNKAFILITADDEAIKQKGINAGKLVGSVAKVLSGGGGGRPHLATAGGKDISKMNEAINEFERLVAEL